MKIAYEKKKLNIHSDFTYNDIFGMNYAPGDFSNLDLSNLTFKRFDGTNGNFKAFHLKNYNFTGNDLGGITLYLQILMVRI